MGFDRDSKKKKPITNSLLLYAPEIAAEWHPTRNGIFRPTYVSYGSHKEVWWLCPLGHAYPATIKNRVLSNSGCPYCGGDKALPGFNDLSTVCPRIAAEWHPSLNGDLTPSKVTRGSSEKVMWLCPKGHAYPATTRNRVSNNSGCPYCSGNRALPGFNDLLTVCPEIAAEWHPLLNGDLTPFNVTKCCNDKVWWLCPLGHAYSAKISNRVSNNTGCPYCSGNRALPGFNDLLTVCPEIAAEWHPLLNGDLTPSNVTKGCNDKVMWLCPKGHAYSASINSRTGQDSGCPYCSGKMVLPGFNDLLTVCPEIAAEWHPLLNGDLTPSNVTKGCKDKVMWLCPKGHAYSASINSRTGQDSGCPYCSGKMVLPGFNDLLTVCPEIAAEWHPLLNGDLTPSNVTKGCKDKVMWLCPKGHTYSASIRNRVSHNSGCPYCKGKKTALEDSFAHLYPELLLEWNYVCNYAICNTNEIKPESNKSVFWICTKDPTHTFPMSIRDRVTYYNRHKEACPSCKGLRRKKNHFI